MKSQVLEVTSNFAWPDLATRFSIIRKPSRHIYFQDSRVLRSTFVLAICLLLILPFFKTSPHPPRKPRSVSNGFIWLTNKPAEVKKSDVKSTPPKEVTPPCAADVINTTTPWLVQCPDLMISFASMKDGPIDTSIFNIYNGEPEGNQEAQLYTNNPRNISVEHGALTLRALNNPSKGYGYTSARVDTKDKKSFLYGRLEIEATLPNNIGAWPAIWMLATNRKYENLSSISDPRRYLNDGEIDIAESVGADPSVVYGIAHSLAHPPGQSTDYFNTVRVPNNDKEFHKYGIDWTPERLSFTLDGQEYFAINKLPNADYKSWPYDQPYYLILNLALGGAWGGIMRDQYPPDGVNTTELPFTMKIRNISYYRLKR